jgi:hypothetical protein
MIFVVRERFWPLMAISNCEPQRAPCGKTELICGGLFFTSSLAATRLSSLPTKRVKRIAR